MSQLFVTPITVEGASDEFAYALMSSAGAVSGHGQATPALLPAADQVTLIVPAQALSWHAVQLPKMPRSSAQQKVQAVLAGILEEHLLDDTAQMHLVALTGLTPGASTWVAACQKPWLRSAVNALQAARLPLTDILAQTWPSDTAHLHVSGTADNAWVMASSPEGVLCLPLSQALSLPSIQQTQSVTAEPAVAGLAEQLLQRRVEVVQLAQWTITRAQAALAQSCSLAQGELAVSGRGRYWQILRGAAREWVAAPAWRPLRWGLIGLLCIQLVGLNAWAWKQQAQVQDKRAQLSQLLTSTFPQVKVVLDAPVQMQRELAQLRQAQGQLSGRDFESIYSRFLGVAGINIAPNAIDFVANEIQLRGLSLSSAQLDALAPRLPFSGLAIRSDAQALIITHQEASGASASVARQGGRP